jgi:hypothetical protein
LHGETPVKKIKKCFFKKSGFGFGLLANLAFCAGQYALNIFSVTEPEQNRKRDKQLSLLLQAKDHERHRHSKACDQSTR